MHIINALYRFSFSSMQILYCVQIPLGAVMHIMWRRKKSSLMHLRRYTFEYTYVHIERIASDGG